MPSSGVNLRNVVAGERRRPGNDGGLFYCSRVIINLVSSLDKHRTMLRSLHTLRELTIGNFGRSHISVFFEAVHILENNVLIQHRYPTACGL